MDLGSVGAEFEAEYSRLVVAGMASRRPVACVGLARNCAEALERNLQQVGTFCDHLHIETNDNTDGTTGVLVDFCDDNPWASYHETFNGRPQLTSEFAGPRTRALAEYRTACQEWVQQHTPDAQYVIVADFDAQGGFDVAGVFHGLAWLDAHPTAWGLASVSLMQCNLQSVTPAGVVEQLGISWVHYDAWALRLNHYGDDYSTGSGGWKHQWIPPCGSPPIPVRSAFGGLTIYRTPQYLSGRYDGADCEHVTFHRSIAEHYGDGLYLNPSQRSIMHLMGD